jgi:pimeloyl-ACP methyl ester carboxylesterase
MSVQSCGVCLALLVSSAACGDAGRPTGQYDRAADAAATHADGSVSTNGGKAGGSAKADAGGSRGTSDSGAGSAGDAGGDGTISMITIKVGELVFDARVAGPADGTPVIMLHGFPETSREWTSEIETVAAAGYRVIAPDQRGYSAGARPPAVEDYKVPLLVADVIGMADTLGIDRFHLVAHDWGASVAWALGASAPERLLTLNPISVPHLDAFAKVLADPSSCQPAASAYFDLFAAPGSETTLLAGGGTFLKGVYAGLPSDVVDYYVKFFDAPTLSAGLNWYRANIEKRMTTGAPIGHIKVPTMYIWSDGDTALCRDGAEITGDYVDGPYRFEIIKGVSHWVPELAAHQVSALLLEHFAAHKDGK